MRVRVQGRDGTAYHGQGVARSHAKKPRLGGQGNRPHKGVGIMRGDQRDALVEYFAALAHRLRWVRSTCGDWTRVLTPAVTTAHGLTGVSLDPPYAHDRRSSRLYRVDSPDLSAAAREWARDHGADPLLRITLCGKDDEHDELLAEGWTRHPWRADGEVIWASPGCVVDADYGPLFLEVVGGQA